MSIQEGVGGDAANAFIGRQPDQGFPVAGRDRTASLHLGDSRRLDVERSRDCGVSSEKIDKLADINHVSKSAYRHELCQHYSCRDFGYEHVMNTPSDRLRQARLKAGFTSASKAAEALGVSPSTYRAHENGQNDFDMDQAKIYAKRLGCDPFWLMAGVEQGDTSKTTSRSRSHDPVEPETDLSGVEGVDGYSVLEIDIRAGAGSGGVEVVPANSMHHGFSVSADAVRDRWRLPESFTRGELRMDPGGAFIIEIYGDSGYDPNNPHAPGSIHSGDRVIVDANDRRPSPPGLFAVHDGIGVVVKLVEFLPRNDPPRIRLLSRNPLYDSYEVVEGEAVIIGRVRGRISSI